MSLHKLVVAHREETLQDGFELDSDANLQSYPIRVASVLRQLQSLTTPERAITLTLEVDESLHVDADEVLLSAALGNLLQNALVFSRFGARVTLVCRAEDSGVVIEIDDEGGGLRPFSLVLPLALPARGSTPPPE